MKSFDVDDDVYAFVLSRAVKIGEDASSILRREFKLPAPKAIPKEVLTLNTKPSVRDGGVAPLSFLSDLEYLHLSNATRRFLFILNWLYKNHPDKWGIVLSIEGNKRRYFARNREDLIAFGNHVAPKQIPGSDYWVVTNNSTHQKCVILENIFRLFGYRSDAIFAVLETL